jgi:hypothetical protein
MGPNGLFANLFDGWSRFFFRLCQCPFVRHNLERKGNLRFVKSRLPLPDEILFRHKQQHPACIGYELLPKTVVKVPDMVHPAFMGHSIMPTRKEGDELLVESSSRDPSTKCHPSYFQCSSKRVPKDFDSEKLHPSFFGKRVEHVPEYKLDFEIEEGLLCSQTLAVL